MRWALLLLMLFACVPYPKASFDQVTFDVDIADSLEEQRQGLMYRESMLENRGMVFVFTEEKPRSFWMKNTRIPLDMIFLDGSFKVVEVKANVRPCEEDPCPSYTSPPAQYVLEINAGLAGKYGIAVGSAMQLRK